MNYLLLTVLGATIFSDQKHQIVGEMVDVDTGEIILILPEKSQEIKKLIRAIESGAGKNNVTNLSYEEFKNLNSSLNSTNQLGNTANGVDSLSCSADGSCDGKVILDKSTTNNY